MTDTNPTEPEWLVVRRSVAASLRAKAAQLLEASRQVDHNGRRLVVVEPADPDAVGSAEGGARTPNPATPPLLRAIRDADERGDRATSLRLKAEQLRRVGSAIDLNTDPNFDLPPDAA